MALQLISSAFTDGGRIPAQYTCEGADTSPPLEWTGAPAETRSFSLVCSDPDAPAGTWYHWAVYDVPAEATDLSEGYPTDAEVGATRQAVNDFKRTGYGGPCPPPGHGTHHYGFMLTALGVDTLDLPAGAGCRDVERAARDHALADTVLTGTYSR